MQDVVMQILYTAEEWVWMTGVMQMRVVKSKARIGVAAALLAAAFLFEGMVGFGFNGPPIWLLIRAATTVIFFSGSILKNLLKYFFAVFNMGIVVDPVRVIFGIVCRHWSVDSGEWPFVIYNEAMQMIVLLLAALFLTGKTVWREKIAQIPSVYFVIGIMLGISASGVTEWGGKMVEGYPVGIQDVYALFSLGFAELIYFFGVGLIILDDLRKRYMEESRLKDQYISMEKEHYLSLENHVKEVRRIRHDMKAHLSAVSHYLSEGQVEKAREYLEKENAKISATDDLTIDVGNPLINAIIAYEKRKMGKEVSFFCEGAFPEGRLPVSEYDLCTIFSNLLANAGEACGRLREKKKEIFLWIGRGNGKVLIQVENPVEWEIDKEKLFSYTSKKDAKEHGYGLLNVKESVEQNGGEMEIDTEDEKFSVRISFAMTGAGQSEQDS